MFKLTSLFLLFSATLAFGDSLTIAHRGASGYLPEHTLEGAAMAHGWNVDYIEPDLVMTKDRQLIIMHDIHLDTTTNVSKIFPKKKRKDGRFYVIDFSLKEIKQLKVNERIDLKTGKRAFPTRFPLNKGDFRVPTFEKFIELIQGLNKSSGRNVGIYPEIKAPSFHRKSGFDITKKVVEVLKKYRYTSKKSKIFLQCFEAKTLKRLRKEFNVKIPLIQLIADDAWKLNKENYANMRTPKGMQTISTYADGMGMWINHLIKVDKTKGPQSLGLIEAAAKLKLPIHVYTLRKEQLPPGFKNLQSLADWLELSLIHI